LCYERLVSFTFRNPVQLSWCWLRKYNGQEKSGEAEAANFRQLFKNLDEVRELIPVDQSCADFIYWAPQVARYSFQSGRVLLAQRDAENTEDN